MNDTVVTISMCSYQLSISRDSKWSSR